MPPRRQADAAAAAAAEMHRYKQQVEAELAQSHQAEQVVKDTASHLQKLADTVRDLPNHLSQPIMVPFGKHAFFLGEIRHTNEVTMHLGCGYHIECTAAHAAGVLERRQQALERSAAQAQKQTQALQARLHLASQEFMPGTLGSGASSGSGGKPGAVGGAAGDVPGLIHDEGEEVVEIRETLEESDELLTSVHASSSKQQAQQPGSGGAGSSGPGSQAGGDDGFDAVFRRIAELEHLEEEAEQAEVLRRRQGLGEQQQGEQQQGEQQQPGAGQGLTGDGVGADGQRAAPHQDEQVASSASGSRATAGASGDLLLPEELFMPVSVEELVSPSSGGQEEPNQRSSERPPGGRPRGGQGAQGGAHLSAQQQVGSASQQLPRVEGQTSASGQRDAAPAVGGKGGASRSGGSGLFRKGFLNAAPSPKGAAGAGGQASSAAKGTDSSSGRGGVSGVSGSAAHQQALPEAAAAAAANIVAEPAKVAVSRREAFTGEVVERGGAAGALEHQAAEPLAAPAVLLPRSPPAAQGQATSVSAVVGDRGSAHASPALAAGLGQSSEAGEGETAVPAKRPSKFKQQMQSNRMGGT